MRPLIIILTVLTLNSCSQAHMTKREVKVDLSGQHLTEIPDSVFQNREITYLNLGSSNVTFYPPLSALTDGNSNSISVLPEQIGNLTKLKTLILNTNKLTSLPNSITKLNNLEVLDLSINKDLDIVQQLDKLKKLPKLRILKIVDVKMTRDEVAIVKSSFHADTKVIMSIPEYIESSK
jgi:Leucine-rich repeat (LRR) protein